MMTKTKEGFCRELLDDDSPRETLDPECLAAAFVDFFNLSARPTLDELAALSSRAGFGDVSEMNLDPGLKGLHFGEPRRKYHIYYRDDLWAGARDLTVPHEVYEIIFETLWDMHSSSAPERKVCKQANRFAAAALMQPDGFYRRARESGLTWWPFSKPTPRWPCGWPRWCGTGP